MIDTTDNQQELFYHVDENDNEIGPITRGEAHDGSKKIHRAIGILIFNPDKSKILLQQRSLTKDTNPGSWTLSIGGHLTYGDEYDNAAKRELQEEIGLETPLQPFQKLYIEDEDEIEWCMVYTTTTAENFPFSLQIEEVQQVRWIPIHELENFVKSNPFAPFGRDVLQAYFTDLSLS